MTKNFILKIEQNVLMAWWGDKSDNSMNLIDNSVMDDLETIIDQLTSDDNIKGCVIISNKQDFSAGANLSVLEESKRQYEQAIVERGEEAANNWFFENSSRLSRIYRRLETCGKPVACAINGICLGGAFELALACHHRVMAFNDKTRVGLPEVKVGLFPGAGGTQRIARLLETDKALQFLLKGNTLDTLEAAKIGLVDNIAPDFELEQFASKWVRQQGDPLARWDKKDFKQPSGKVFSPKGMMTWPAANAIYRKETYDNYPGARAIMTAVYEGLQVDIDTGLRIESRLFANVLRSKEAEAMIRTLFLSKNELDKGARRPPLVPPLSIKKVGIIGAGMMGAGIAYVSAMNGLEVVLVDSSQENANKGIVTVDSLASKQVSKGKMKQDKKEELIKKITPTVDYALLSDVDLVIEAVYEDRDIKSTVIKQVQEKIGKNVVFATNTSTLPVSSLAESSLDPTKFIGIHFFSPVDKMQLVEVILGNNTQDIALATALDFVRIIKKTPIVVNDCRGFYANRCVLSYIREAHIMLNEGVPPAMIENCAKMIGMPVGPLALNDEVSLELALNILKATKADLGDAAIDPIQENILKFMVEVNRRYGRKNHAGFYDYAQDGSKKLWAGLSQLQPNKLKPESIDVEELKLRFLIVQALEAARTVDEGIVSEKEADVGSIFGFGFPPYTGGTISFIKQTGIEEFKEICKRLEAKFGERYTIPWYLN